MTRDDLARALQTEHDDITISGMKEIVRDLFVIMADALAGGTEIGIHEFGKFKVKTTKERKFHNPRTGEFEVAAPKNKVVFSSASALRELIR